MNHPLYSDDTFTGQVTEYLIANGDTIFQTHRLAPSERDHVAKLLDFFMPPQGATILDLGCGVGGFAAIASEIRPDLKFILLNQSQAQLDLCPQWQKVCGSFAAASDLRPDAATIQWALGHGDVHKIFQTVGEILPAGGIFLVYDLVRVGQLFNNFEDVMFYTPYHASAILEAAEQSNLSLDIAFAPNTSTDRYVSKHMPREEFDSLFAGIRPMIFRFIK